MKKQIMSVMLSAVLVLGTASTAFGATKIERGSIDCKDAVNKLQNYIIQYFEKYCGNSNNENDQDHEDGQENNGNQDSNQNENTDQDMGNGNNGNSNGQGENGGTSGGNQDESQDKDEEDQDEIPSVQVGEKQAEVVKLVNQERAEAGLGSLSGNQKLHALAQMKAEDMAKNKYFSHTSPTYGSAFDMLKQYNVSYKTAGENIAKGQKTAQSVMTGWMNSQGHRANILGSGYTQIGVGYATDSNGTPYWVQIFVG